MANGSQVYRQHALQTSGEIVVPNGGSVQAIEVYFLDANGARISIANDCPINEMRFAVEDPSVIEITYDTAMRWKFTVLGKREGATTLRVYLWHESHAHFRSEAIPVRVVVAP